jgi:hypothetical protein
MNSNNLNKYFEMIERPTFTAMFTAANNAYTYKMIFESNVVIRSFINDVRIDTEGSKDVFQRIKRLIAVQYDKNISHPYDDAIAVYLLILSKTSVDNFINATNEITTKKISNLYWTYMILNDLGMSATNEITENINILNKSIDISKLSTKIIKNDDFIVYAGSSSGSTINIIGGE